MKSFYIKINVTKLTSSETINLLHYEIIKFPFIKYNGTSWVDKSPIYKIDERYYKIYKLYKKNKFNINSDIILFFNKYDEFLIETNIIDFLMPKSKKKINLFA